MGKRAREQGRAQRRSEAPPASVPASRPVVPATPRGNTRWDALAALSATVDQVRSLEARRDRQVAAARSAGASWTDVARALGVSPQAVQQRFGKPRTPGVGSS